jgi:hypothetical protein
MCLSALLLSLTIDSHAVIASICIMLFVASFSIGLGPIPFIIIPEVVPAQSAPSVGSIGLSLNWIMNFIVAASFLPLDQALGTSGVLLVFAGITAVSAVAVSAVYKP